MIAAAIFQTAIVGAALLILERLLRRSDARFRHALLCIGLLKFAVPPFIFIPAARRQGVPAEESIWINALLAVYLIGAAIALLNLGVRWLRLRAVIRWRRSRHSSTSTWAWARTPIPTRWPAGFCSAARR